MAALGGAAMKPRGVIALVFATLIAAPFVAYAQQRTTPAAADVNCDSLPVGPSRTDCYIGLSRISRQKGEIAAGVAQQIKDSARYRQVTGQRRNMKTHARKQK